MINEIDESLRSLITTQALPAGSAEVVFDAPSRDWAARRNSPTIDAYLYDIREEVRRRGATRSLHPANSTVHASTCSTTSPRITSLMPPRTPGLQPKFLDPQL